MKPTRARRTPPKGYRVTAEGQIISFASNWRGYGVRAMTQTPNAHGYLTVSLTSNHKMRKYFVHKLVAHKFLPRRPSSKYQLRHLDGNCNNNHKNNLAWGTNKDNADDRAKHGRTAYGEKLSIAVKKGIRNSKNPYFRHARIEQALKDMDTPAQSGERKI